MRVASAVGFSLLTKLPLIVSSCPPSMLLENVWSLAPAALVTLPVKVMACCPPKTAVELLSSWMALETLSGPP